MEFRISVSDSFEASHRLPDGSWTDCSAPHGHTWRVTVTLMQLQLGRDGQIAKSEELQKELRILLEQYRNRDLNDKFVGGDPTPGNLAVNIMERLSLRFPRIQSVTVKMGKEVEVTAWRELRS